MGLAAALRHLNRNGVAVVAARRADILIDANSFELKIMPAVGSLLAHVAAAAASDIAAAAFHESTISRFVELLCFLRPMMNRSRYTPNDGDELQFSSEKVAQVLCCREWDDEVAAHEDVRDMNDTNRWLVLILWGAVCIMLMFVVWGLAFDFKRFIFNIVFLFISNGCVRKIYELV